MIAFARCWVPRGAPAGGEREETAVPPCSACRQRVGHAANPAAAAAAAAAAAQADLMRAAVGGRDTGTALRALILLVVLVLLVASIAFKKTVAGGEK